MGTLEELVAQPKVSLALCLLWTRLQRQAVEEDKDVAEIMVGEMNKSPRYAQMLSLLGVWLEQQD